MSYSLGKALVLSITCSKCKNDDEKIFKEKSIEILKILGLIENNNHFKNMCKENRSRIFRLKNIDEKRNYFLEKLKQNELMSK